jgi:hypothetical protein
MPRQKDLKRIVRSRMEKTGESYTAARLQIVKKNAEPAPDYAALAGMSDAAVEKQTGRDWAGWVKILDHAGAASMEHRQIAGILDKHGVPGWWSQMVTVGYERIRGLRAIGQRRSGSWEAAKSKTFSVPVGVLFRAFEEPKTRKRWLDAKLTVRTASAPKSMRMTWEDGTSVQFWFTAKGDAKSSVAVQHTKLASKQDADRLRSYWSERLEALSDVLAK